MEPQQTSKAFVVNVLHDGADGQNSVMLDLDNENDSFLYDGNGNRISDAVTSQATLFDGYDRVLSGITWSISQASGVELINGGAATDTAPDISLHPTAAWITSGGVVTVYGMSSQVVSGLVKVCATYNGNSYYKELTLKRIVNGDKYTLVLSPSSIPYNPNETYESQTITASATRLTAEGKTYDVTFNSGGMYLAAYYKPNASDPAAWYQCSGTLSVTEAIAQNNSNIRFELRRAKAGQVYDKDLPATYAVEDFETIPIPRDGKDGKNSIRLTLDNEHEDFLYSDSGTSPIAPALGATSQARLYDGETEVLAANVGWSISASSGVVTNDSSSPYYASVSNGLLTVKGINADTAYVTVRAKYPNTDDGKYYYAKFTANKTSQDKYDLIVRPNAISYNSATYPQAGTTIELSSKRTDLQGQQTDVTIRASQTIAAGYVYVFYGFVKADGTVVKPSNPNVAGVENLGATSRVISASEASTYSGIYLELRKYTDTTNYRLCDYETVEIAKAENGTNGTSGQNSVRLDLDNEMDSIQYQGDGSTKVNPSASVSTTATLYDGSSTPSATITVDTAHTTIAAANYSLSGNVLTVTGLGSPAADGYVTLQCTYNEVTYKAKFSVKALINQDKYDLDISPNSLFLNTDDGWSGAKTIAVKVMRTPAGGGTPTAVDPSTYGLTLAASVGTLSNYNSTTHGFTLTITQQQATDNEDTVITLYKTSATNVHDRETIPFNKAENGSDGNGIVSITKTYGISASGTTESDAYPPSDITSWSAGSPAVTEAKPYLWVKEETVYTDTTRNTTKYYCIGRRGDNGVDAKDVEFAYIRTKTNQAPEIYSDNNYTDSNNKTYTSDDHLPRVNGSNRNDIEENEGTSTYPECTDDPKGVDDEYKYEWEVKRTKGPANGVTGARSWNYYQGTMTLHNNFAESAFIIDLDNDNDQFGTDSESKVLVEQTRSTTVSLYDGATLQTLTDLSATLTYEDGTSVPTSVATKTANKNTGVVEVTVKVNNTANTHTEIQANITATCAKGTKTAVFKLRKIMGGAPGLNPVIYQLAPTQKVFSFYRDSSNGLLPASQSSQINVARTEGNTTTILSTAQTGITYSWGFDISDTAVESGKAVGSSITITNTQGNGHYQVWVQLSTGDRETLSIVKDGTNGDNGDPAVVYILEPSPDNVNYRSNSVGDYPETKTVTCTVKKVVGNNAPVIITPDSSSGVYLYYRAVGSNVWSTYQTWSGVGDDVLSDGLSGLEYALSSASSYGDVTDSNIITRKTVSILFDGRRGVAGTPGTPGTPGANGKMFYSLGEWKAQAYTRTELSIPMVHYDDGDFNEATGYGNYYYLNADSASAGDVPGTSEKWVKAEGFGVVITQGLFAEFAKLGSAIMSGDYMFSMNGRIGNTEYKNGQKIDGVPAYTKFIGDPDAEYESEVEDTLDEGDRYDLSNPFEMSRGISLHGSVTLYAEPDSLDVVLKLWNKTDGGYTYFYANGNLVDEVVLTDTPTEYSLVYNYINYDPGERQFVLLNKDDYDSYYVKASINYHFEGVFEPNWWVDLKTGKMLAARGNFVVAPDGDVKVTGTISAKLFYAATKTITSDNYQINLKTEPYFTYFKQPSATDPSYRVKLPDPSTCEGVELRFFSPVVGSGGNVMRVYWPNNTINLCLDTGVSAVDAVAVKPFKMGTLKAISGEWWTVDDGFVAASANAPT